MPESKRDALFSRQPGKALWTLFAVAFNAVKLPIVLIYWLVPFTRPTSSWTWKQTVRVWIVRTFLYHASAVEMRTPLSLRPGWEGKKWVTLSPAQPKYYTGVADCDQEIKPAEIGGTWYPAPPGVVGSDSKPGYVVMHFHGGAYVIGDGRGHDAGFAAKTLIKHTQATHVFAPQYRLASNDGGRFPAALQDAITSYTYLVFVQGIHPSKIIVSGDSAGANLALALLRYISDHGTKLGLLSPGCAWLFSPWSNIGFAHNNPAALDLNPNITYDYVGGEFGAWGARCLAPHPKTGLDIWNPSISFVDHPFKTETPCWISGGEYEVLIAEIVKFAEQMRKTEGNVTILDIQEKCPHDIILVGALTGFEKQAAQAAQRADAWFKSVKSGS